MKRKASDDVDQAGKPYLTQEQLAEKLEPIIKAQKIRECLSNLSQLEQLLSGKKPDDASFSEVEYNDVCEQRARLPDDIFWDILRDIKAAMVYNGISDYSYNGEERSRYISSFLNKLIPLFSGMLRNQPEMLPKSHITKPGSIAHYYTVSGVMTVLFIELKDPFHLYEQLDHYGQIIAESIDLSLMDSQRRFQLPVMGIPTDGKRFQVFKFEAGKGQLPRFSLGKFSNGFNILSITQSSVPTYTVRNAVLELRAVCEYLYSVFLWAYHHGLTAWWNYEVQRSNQQGDMASTSDWEKAVDLASEAFDQAKTAFTLHEAGASEESQAMTWAAVDHLTESSADMVPFSKHHFLPGITREMASK